MEKVFKGSSVRIRSGEKEKIIEMLDKLTGLGKGRDFDEKSTFDWKCASGLCVDVAVAGRISRGESDFSQCT